MPNNPFSRAISSVTGGVNRMKTLPQQFQDIPQEIRQMGKSFKDMLPGKLNQDAMNNYEKTSLQGNPIQMPSQEMGRNLRDLPKVEVGFQARRSVPQPYPKFEFTDDRAASPNRSMTEDLASKYMQKYRILRNNPLARKAEQTDLRPYANKYKGG